MIEKCEGSGQFQMVDWPPDENSMAYDGKPYPGASVCVFCSYGVLLVRGSIHKAVSGAGREGDAGKLRVHYVKGDPRRHDWPEQMAYAKGDL